MPRLQATPTDASSADTTADTTADTSSADTTRYHQIPADTTRYQQIPADTTRYHQIPAEPSRTQQLPPDATRYIPSRRNDEHHSTTDDHSDFTPQMPLDITRSPLRSHHRSYQHPLPPRSTSALCLMYVLGDAVAVHFAYSRQRSAGIERGGSQGVGMQLYGRRPLITLQYS